MIGRRCETPLAFEDLVDHWAGELAPERDDEVELHLMGCAECSARSERVAAVVSALRSQLPVAVDAALVARLRAEGVRIGERRFTPGTHDVVFGEEHDVLLHHLGGLDLSRAERVALTVRAEHGGEIIAVAHDAPFDRDAGEVIVCCQRHFVALPHDIVIELRARERGGAETSASYALRHAYTFAR